MLWWIAGAAAAGLLIHLFLTAPSLKRPGKRAEALGGWRYAHRGLHGGGIPENSLPAFARAAEKGYGVELDVHLTRDGRLAVFHDDTLKRLCGCDQTPEEMTMAELKRLSLAGTEERIPELGEVLALLGGGTPLIVEMKSAKGVGSALPEAVRRRMEDYPGLWCVECFDPRLLRWFRKHAPGVIRGQLAFDPRRDPREDRGGALLWCAARLLMNFLSRPDFIAYGYRTEGNYSFRMMRAWFHPVLAAWTVRSKEDSEKLKDRYAIQIFESFEP